MFTSSLSQALGLKITKNLQSVSHKSVPNPEYIWGYCLLVLLKRGYCLLVLL